MITIEIKLIKSCKWGNIECCNNGYRCKIYIGDPPCWT